MPISPFILFFSICAAVAGIVLFYAFRRILLMKKKLQEDGSLTKGDEISIDGRVAYLSHYSLSRYSSPEFKIFMNGTFGAALVIRRERALDRFWKSIGLNKEVQIPDRELADKFYFECDDQRFLNQLLSDAAAKPLILNVFSRFNSIEITPTSCTFKQCPSDPLDDLGKDFIMDAAHKLSDFVDLIPVSAGAGSSQLNFFKTCRGVLNFLGAGVLGLGFLFFFWAGSYTLVDEIRSWGLAMQWFWAPYVSAVCFAFVIIKGFSTSARVLIRFLICFGIGAFMVLRFGGVVYNCFFDHSPADRHQQIVIDKYLSHNKKVVFHNVDVTPWRAGMKNWAFAVNPGEYSQIRPGITRYIILTKPGRLHFEWVTGQKMAKA